MITRRGLIYAGATVSAGREAVLKNKYRKMFIMKCKYLDYLQWVKTRLLVFKKASNSPLTIYKNNGKLVL